jgi:ArsR family transcriptional regulator
VVDSNGREAVSGRAALLSAIADPIRLGLVDRLAAEGTRCVCDLQTDPRIPANLLSYHLKVLRDAGLVTTARRGRWVDYTLAEDGLARLREALPAPGRSLRPTGHRAPAMVRP